MKIPKATIDLPDGTKVIVDGSTEEITELLDHYSEKGKKTAAKKTTKPKGSKSKKPSMGPTGLIRDLIDNGYFKERRSLGDIQLKLEEGGHIYAQTSLSPVLVRLVKNKELRRVKENKRWVYVNK